MPLRGFYFARWGVTDVAIVRWPTHNSEVKMEQPVDHMLSSEQGTCCYWFLPLMR